MSLRNIDSVVKRSLISTSNLLSVSACNTLTTTPIVKKLCHKNNCYFFPTKKIHLPIFNSYLLNRIRILLIYAHVLPKPIPLIKKRIEYLTKALLIPFYWQFLTKNSGFCLINTLVRKFYSLSKKEVKWKKHKFFWWKTTKNKKVSKK